MASKILIVEDEQTTRSLMEFKLKNCGYEVHTVDDGRTALDILEKMSFDLIILDLMMPLMSGKELLVQLRNTPATKSVPIIIVTARTLEADIVEGLALGADDFVRKPFSPSELVARVRTLLGRRQGTPGAVAR
jgi:DNA-binding response OmpR family regulator